MRATRPRILPLPTTLPTPLASNPIVYPISRAAPSPAFKHRCPSRTRCHLTYLFRRASSWRSTGTCPSTRRSRGDQPRGHQADDLAHAKDLVSCRFSWKHYYWFLNDEGIEYLHEYLHLPEDMVPNTLRRPPRPPAAAGPTGRRGRRQPPPRPPRSFGGDREGYRSERPDGPPRGFGRGAPRPQPA